MKNLRFKIAAVVAFLMGVPFVEQARADAFDITSSAISLGLSIADAAGNS